MTKFMMTPEKAAFVREAAAIHVKARAAYDERRDKENADRDKQKAEREAASIEQKEWDARISVLQHEKLEIQHRIALKKIEMQLKLREAEALHPRKAA